MTDAAIGIIFNSKNELLLVQRQDVSVWVLPGGGIDPGESPEAAATREVFEETGLRTQVSRKIAEYTPINRLSHFTHVFLCEFVEGSLQKGSETCDVQFFTLDQLPSNLFFIHHDWIHDALLNHTDVIRKPLDQVTYWAFIKYLVRHPLQTLRFLWTQILIRTFF